MNNGAGNVSAVKKEKSKRKHVTTLNAKKTSGFASANRVVRQRIYYSEESQGKCV